MTKLNSITKYIVAIGLIAMMVLTMTVTPSYAIDKIDEGEDASLTVIFSGEKKAPGMKFSAYKVGEFDENNQFHILSKYAGYGVGEIPQDQDGYKAMASTLKGYIQKDGLEADYTATTNEDGVAAFGTVEKGLYLIFSNTVIYNETIYKTVPVMVSVPNLDANEKWVYDVEIASKYSSEPVPPKEEKLDINAIKIWAGDVENERPASIIIELLCDGEVIETATLSKYNNWRVSWKDLDATKEYEVTESVVPGGYEVKIEREGNTFTVTNTFPPSNPDKDVKDSYAEPEPGDKIPPTPGNITPTPSNQTKTPPPSSKTTTKLPQTGQLWWPVPIMLGAGIVLFLAGVIRRRRSI